MKRTNILYITIFLLVLFSGCLAIWVYYLREGKDLLNFTISIVGFCIALLALFIAVRTYTSIDSVNNISKMDGNILDNERYVTSLPELISQYKSKNEKDLDEKLFESIERKLKRDSNTAVLFADTLQYLIDLIVLFPAVFNAADTDKKRYKKRMDKILKDIDKQRDILQSISKGNSIQIIETIKLFKAVVSYQSFVANGNFNIHADLLHVRGPILRNPVTKTIYHNYLGLYYNKKGMHLLKESLSMGARDILSIDGLDSVRSNIDSLSPSVIEELLMYLRSACEQFDRALKISCEDVMWPGFINYNKARTLYFINLLSESKESWIDVMDDAVKSRSRLNRLIDEVLTVNQAGKAEVMDTHLRQFFLYQEELSRVIKLNLMLSDGENKSKISPIIYRGSNIENLKKEELMKLFINVDSFPSIKSYQEKVVETLAIGGNSSS
ncbi:MULTISPECIES: hypothetical protein [Shewanella]|nr:MULTISPECIES: hypothetical protein [Shewanella]MBW0295326.1 hypothetical protein [Shewanella xiamenensis]MDH1312885.1 hypothetical protein [Shewanella xiamenensis]MDI5834551.1 hypothetical protein [Shewanella xiamenensis]MDI5838491.1 hypothetical protein [Shewanella xiamenensis]MDI5842443.1 hypothetical protein [Shewanella xiamenensis]